MNDTFDVEMPDGTIIEGVPVGTTRAQLEAKLGKQQTAPAPQSARDVLEQHMGPSDFTKAFASTPARILKSGMQMVGAGDYVPGVINEMAAEGDKSMAGRIAGDVAGTGGIKASVGALAQTLQKLNAARGVVPAVARTAEAATYGAGQGAITTPDQQGEAALYGGAGGAGGQMLGRAIGGIVRPSVAAQPLVDAGVALTPGQAAGKGSFMKWAEEQAASLPVAGHAIRNAQGRAVADANVAAAQVVARQVNDKVKLGQPPREAIEQTREAISNAYDEALTGMKAPKTSLNDYMKLAFNGNKDHGIPSIAQDPTIPPQAKKMLADYMSMKYSQAPAEIDGRWLKEMDSEVGYRARQLASSPDPLQRAGAPAWQTLQAHLRNLMEEAAPDNMKGQLGSANQAYRELLALEKSMLPGADTFTPRRLRATLEKMNNSKLPGTDLGRMAASMDKTLPNTVPNSGTAERLLTAGLPALLLGGGAGAQSMGYGELGAGMMAAGALGSRPGARMMTGGYGWQPEAAAAIRALRGAPVRPSRQDDEK